MYSKLSSKSILRYLHFCGLGMRVNASTRPSRKQTCYRAQRRDYQIINVPCISRRPINCIRNYLNNILLEMLHSRKHVITFYQQSQYLFIYYSNSVIFTVTVAYLQGMTYDVRKDSNHKSSKNFFFIQKSHINFTYI